MSKKKRYLVIAVMLCLLIPSVLLFYSLRDTGYAACMPYADLPFECDLKSETDPKTVQIFMALQGNAYHVIGRQEVSGVHHISKRLFSGQHTHLAVVFNADGTELARQALRFHTALPFDTFQNDVLSGGMATNMDQSTSLRYSAFGQDDHLKIYALPKETGSTRDVYDYEPMQMEAVYAMDLR